jgi:hypothetical protein
VNERKAGVDDNRRSVQAHQKANRILFIIRVAIRNHKKKQAIEIRRADFHQENPKHAQEDQVLDRG